MANYKVITSSITNAAHEDFAKLFAELEAYAAKHRLKPPKKSDVLSKMIQAYKTKPDEFFKS